MASILDLDRPSFFAALDELGIQGPQRDDLIRQYRVQSAGLLGSAMSAGGVEPGRVRADILPMTRPQGMTGLEAIRSGEAELAVPGILTGLLSGGAQAIDAPRAVMAGEVPQSDLMSEAMNVAGMTSLGAAGMPAPADALRMGAARRDERLWHPISGVKMSKPIEEMQFSVTPTGSLAAPRTVSIEDLQGSVMIPAYGDRTAAGGLLTQIEGRDIAPVVLQGGRDFMREAGTGVWASEKTPMQTKANVARDIAQSGRQPLLVYSSMGAQAGDFSHMMADAVMGQIPLSKITKKAAKEYDNVIKERVDPSWPGILSADAKSYVDSMTGTNRRLLWQEMDKASLREKGFPDIAATRNAITEQSLRDVAPMSGGTAISRPETSGLLMEAPEIQHATYSHQLGGDYIGGLEQTIPGEILWRNFFDARRAAGAAPAGDQRAMMMQSKMSQLIDQQMVDEVSRYLESLRSGR